MKKRIIIADERTGARPIGKARILNAVFDGDHPGYLTLDDGRRITCDDRPNYHSDDGREYAEVQQLEHRNGIIESIIIGYTEVWGGSYD